MRLMAKQKMDKLPIVVLLLGSVVVLYIHPLLSLLGVALTIGYIAAHLFHR